MARHKNQRITSYKFARQIIASEERDELERERRAAAGPIRIESVHQTWPCWNCRDWVMDGAYKKGRCNFCNAPREKPQEQKG